MTWTYDGSPGTATAAERRDAVRLLVGDTDTNDQLATDEEITFALSQGNDNVYLAGGIIARSISASFARRADMSIEGLRVQYSQRASGYEKLAIKLDREAKRKGGSLAAPAAGGISIDQMDSVEDDDDRPRPSFRRKQFDNPPGYDDDAEGWEDYHR